MLIHVSLLLEILLLLWHKCQTNNLHWVLFLLRRNEFVSNKPDLFRWCPSLFLRGVTRCDTYQLMVTGAGWLDTFPHCMLAVPGRPCSWPRGHTFYSALYRRYRLFCKKIYKLETHGEKHIKVRTEDKEEMIETSGKEEAQGTIRDHH